MRETNDVVLDRALYLWFSQRRSKGGLLCENVLELNEKLGGLAYFKASTACGREGYSRDDVYNVEETGINWKALPRKSLASKQESTAPSFKVSKERVTAMICANVSGTHDIDIACDWQI
ncbi:jerky-like protein [Trichonephila clavipes]|uniref:Jerky-like protein n=1 Tax=Trichonephila clavipes TaxID=2585209 RepID=A0A8X6WBJ3_TRICX|nr:jerky-like protein [Trichonephila clavipes]